MTESPIPYPIETAPQPTSPGDMQRIVESLRALRLKRNNSFVIPAFEVKDESGRWSAQKLGQRVHHAAGRVGIKVKVKRQSGKNGAVEGLRVWRIA